MNIILLDIPQHPTRVNDSALMERWGCDVLDAEGEARLRAVVDSIKAVCDNIADAACLNYSFAGHGGFPPFC